MADGISRPVRIFLVVFCTGTTDVGPIVRELFLPLLDGHRIQTLLGEMGNISCRDKGRSHDDCGCKHGSVNCGWFVFVAFVHNGKLPIPLRARNSSFIFSIFLRVNQRSIVFLEGCGARPHFQPHQY